MTYDTPEMTGTKSKFRSKFQFRLDSVPATGRNFSGILNLADGDDPVLQAIEESMADIEDEIAKKQKELDSLIATPQKSNITPTRN
jgi:hypothetical protein